jgi:hypothetical protein
MNKILYVSVAVAAVLGPVAVASAQSQRSERPNSYYTYGEAGPSEARQTGRRVPRSRLIEHPQPQVAPFTWEGQRTFDYQQQRN